MKSKLIFFVIFAFLILGTTTNTHCCTVGAVAGSVTQDGRPIIWKTRDSADDQQTIKFIDNSSDNSKYSYV